MYQRSLLDLQEGSFLKEESLVSIQDSTSGFKPLLLKTAKVYQQKGGDEMKHL